MAVKYGGKFIDSFLKGTYYSDDIVPDFPHTGWLEFRTIDMLNGLLYLVLMVSDGTDIC